MEVAPNHTLLTLFSEFKLLSRVYGWMEWSGYPLDSYDYWYTRAPVVLKRYISSELLFLGVARKRSFLKKKEQELNNNYAMCFPSRLPAMSLNSE